MVPEVKSNDHIRSVNVITLNWFTIFSESVTQSMSDSTPPDWPPLPTVTTTTTPPWFPFFSTDLGPASTTALTTSVAAFATDQLFPANDVTPNGFYNSTTSYNYTTSPYTLDPLDEFMNKDGYSMVETVAIAVVAVFLSTLTIGKFP